MVQQKQQSRQFKKVGAPNSMSFPVTTSCSMRENVNGMYRNTCFIPNTDQSNQSFCISLKEDNTSV